MMLAATRTRRTRKRREPAWEDAPKCLSDCDDRDEQRVGTGPAGVRHVRGGRASLESSTERESSALCEVGVVGPGRGRGQGQSMARRRGIAFNVVGFAGKVRTFDAIRRFCYSDTALVRIHSVTLTQVAALVRIHSPKLQPLFSPARLSLVRYTKGKCTQERVELKGTAF